MLFNGIGVQNGRTGEYNDFSCHTCVCFPFTRNKHGGIIENLCFSRDSSLETTMGTAINPSPLTTDRQVKKA